MVNKLDIILENEVVKLRAMTKADCDAIFALNDPVIWTHMSVTLDTREAVTAYIDMALEKQASGTAYFFVIIDKKTNQIVGGTSFSDYDTFHKRLEVGYTWHHPSVWRTNINSNCKYLLLTYAFEQLKVNRVQIKTGHENHNSQRAIERLGAIKEGVLRNHMIKKDGTIRHTVLYSMTIEDWPSIKQRFEAQLLI